MNENSGTEANQISKSVINFTIAIPVKLELYYNIVLLLSTSLYLCWSCTNGQFQLLCF